MGFPQDFKYSFGAEMPEAVETDALGNVYVVVGGGEIFKFNGRLELIGKYSSNSLVEISQLSVNQEQKVLIFSESLQKAEILDRFLNKLAFLDLSIGSDQYFTEILLGSHGGLWLFDSERLTLIRTPKLDLNNGLETELSFLSGDINRIKECGAQLIAQSASSLFVFDNLGQFMSKVESTSDSFSCTSKDIYSVVNNELVKLDRGTGNLISMYKDFKYLSYSISSDWVYAIQKNELYRFKLAK